MPRAVFISAKQAPALEVRKSVRGGRGVFTLASIPVGAFIAPLTGRLVHRNDIDWATYEGLIMQADEDWFMEAAGGIDDYFNHSCEPNMAFTPDGESFYAVRDIGSNEELFFDYSTCEDDLTWKVPCHCGAATCRGHITGFSALDSALQRRLLPYCRPYLRARFAER